MPVGLVSYTILITEYIKYLAFSPDKYSAVLIPVRLEDISSDIALECKINMPYWSTSPNQLWSFEPVTLPVRLGIINSDITSKYNINRQS